MRRLLVAGVLCAALVLGGTACGQSDETANVASEGPDATASESGGDVTRTPWITERRQTQDENVDEPVAGPTEEAPTDYTRALLTEFQARAGEGFEQGDLGRYILPDGSEAHFGQLYRGVERLSFTTQRLTAPLELLPEEGSPLREMGEYLRQEDGTEVLVVETNKVMGTTSPSDRQVYVVEPSGQLTEISYRLVSAEEIRPGEDTAGWLTQLGRDMNRYLEAN